MPWLAAITVNYMILRISAIMAPLSWGDSLVLVNYLKPLLVLIGQSVYMAVGIDLRLEVSGHLYQNRH